MPRRLPCCSRPVFRFKTQSKFRNTDQPYGPRVRHFRQVTPPTPAHLRPRPPQQRALHRHRGEARWVHLRICPRNHAYSYPSSLALKWEEMINARAAAAKNSRRVVGSPKDNQLIDAVSPVTVRNSGIVSAGSRWQSELFGCVPCFNIFAPCAEFGGHFIKNSTRVELNQRICG